MLSLVKECRDSYLFWRYKKTDQLSDRDIVFYALNDLEKVVFSGLPFDIIIQTALSSPYVKDLDGFCGNFNEGECWCLAGRVLGVIRKNGEKLYTIVPENWL